MSGERAQGDELTEEAIKTYGHGTDITDQLNAPDSLTDNEDDRTTDDTAN